jgi:hypothetical protein
MSYVIRKKPGLNNAPTTYIYSSDLRRIKAYTTKIEEAHRWASRGAAEKWLKTKDRIYASGYEIVQAPEQKIKLTHL